MVLDRRCIWLATSEKYADFVFNFYISAVWAVHCPYLFLCLLLFSRTVFLSFNERNGVSFVGSVYSQDEHLDT
jgi:hypothetical protein